AKMLPPKTTINEAEYSGLIDGLKYLNENRIDDVKIFGDSLLVVNQLKGSYRVKAKNLEKYHKKAKELIGKRQITWIKRTENELADTECD
ncbi:reverse transcriptase-like protein, partial [Streptococcus pneumoniae]|uniref:reverse transcriptase-like protein n=1 Tax=Streptococcus pneumoniae TaxID=1313 RepID=UPI001CBCA9D5